MLQTVLEVLATSLTHESILCGLKKIITMNKTLTSVD